MIGKVCVIENKVHDIQNDHAGHYQEVLKKLEKMDNNLKRIAVIPAQRVRPQRVDGGGGGSNESEVHHPANLCRCPKNLYVLSAEYESGVGGNKPARLCNKTERSNARINIKGSNTYQIKKQQPTSLFFIYLESMCSKNLFK